MLKELYQIHSEGTPQAGSASAGLTAGACIGGALTKSESRAAISFGALQTCNSAIQVQELLPLSRRAERESQPVIVDRIEGTEQIFATKLANKL